MILRHCSGWMRRCATRARSPASLATPWRRHNGWMRRRCDGTRSAGVRGRRCCGSTALEPLSGGGFRRATTGRRLRRLVYSTRQPPSGDRRFAPRTRSERESPHQADVSTQEALSAQDARVSRSHGDAGRPAGAEGAASQGTQALDSRCPAVIPVQRLRGRARIAAVRSRGTVGRADRLRVSVLMNGERRSRAAVAVVGARGAVERNRLRRQLRAASRVVLAAAPGCDVVVHAKAGRDAVRFAALVDSLRAALRNAHGRLPA